MTSQVVLNGVLAGLTWGLVALGFTVVYGTVRVLHAAHGATFLVGAYVGISVSRWTASPVICIVGAAVASCTLGILIEGGIYRPLRRLRSSGHIVFLASLAALLIVENLVALVFGSELQVARQQANSGTLTVLGARATSVRVWAAIAAVLLFAGTWAFSRCAPAGRRMRAVASDSELATVVGIDSEATFLLAMGIGSALAGAAGFLVAYDTAAGPTMGFSALLVGVTAAVVGGVGSIPGAMLGGVLVGVAQHLGAWLLPPQWQETIVFGLLVVVLLVRPRGFLGTPLRRTTA